MIHNHPESKQKLITLATNVVKKAGVEHIVPTPLDTLVEASQVSCTEDLFSFKESFLKRLPKAAKDKFHSGIQKIKGIADLRERAICVPADQNKKKNVFPKAHELGHQVIPWHNINPQGYIDNQFTLSPEVEDKFDLEANFFAQEIIFPTKLFTSEARDYKASFDAIFCVANKYGATIQSTMWKYIEVQDEKILLAPYYPLKDNSTVLKRWKPVASKNFKKKHSGIKLPEILESGHPWVAAKDTGTQCSGADNFNCNGFLVPFEWTTFWNGYTLFVMLRETPSLGVLGKIFG